MASQNGVKRKAESDTITRVEKKKVKQQKQISQTSCDNENKSKKTHRQKKNKNKNNFILKVISEETKMTPSKNCLKLNWLPSGDKSSEAQGKGSSKNSSEAQGKGSSKKSSEAQGKGSSKKSSEAQGQGSSKKSSEAQGQGSSKKKKFWKKKKKLGEKSELSVTDHGKGGDGIKLKVKATSADDFLSEKDKVRLSVRQKHKILKMKLKKKNKLKDKKVKDMREKDSEKTGTTMQVVMLPKKSADISSNWKQLQASLKQPSLSNKKKFLPKNIRNPKLLKKTGKEVQTDSGQQVKNESTPEIWFDDVDEIFLEKKPVEKPKPGGPSSNQDDDMQTEPNPLIKPDAYKGLTKVVGLDCEMVGVGDGTENMLARVSLVNQYGEQIYDQFVKPREKVVDYRTHVSGVTPELLQKGLDFEKVQKDVSDILNGRILVGHALRNDLQVLYLSHPKKMIRDTSRYKPFRQLFGGRNPALKKLSQKVLGVAVQEGEHNSVQDAQAAMRLYTMYRQRWEAEIKEMRKGRRGVVKEKKAKTKT